MNLLNIKDTVLDLLNNNPHLRDNDQALISNIWWKEVKQLQIKDSIKDFLDAFSKGKLSNPESIRRCRQKHQELHPHLRGNNWQNRQEQQIDVKGQINLF